MRIFKNFEFGSFLSKQKLVDTKKQERVTTNQITTENFDGAIEYDGYSQISSALDWSYNDQSEMILGYRSISNYPTVDYAIDDIINEMVSFSENENPIELDLSELEEDLSENIRTKIYDAYEKIANLLDLKNTIHRRARSFYIDGRLAYQKVIDKDRPKDGLIGIIELDARHLTKIRQRQYDRETKTLEHVEETFYYKEDSITTKQENIQTTKASTTHKEGFELNPESITYVTSGLIDHLTGYAISWLHKAVNPANKLMMMENALLIYRITRAPERRIFYVDVSMMPTAKATQYIQQLKNMYNNRMTFDPTKGTFTDGKHLQTMQEDFWLPRNSDGKGTDVSTLPGGQNLGEISDLLFFQQQLYRSLNLPLSRLETESSLIGGRGAEITRDELKHLKNVSKIRKRFNRMLLDLIRTEVILSNVMTIQEWDEINEKIQFVYSQDMYMEELRKTEIVRERLSLLSEMENYIGKYFSHKYIRREVLKQTETEREEMDKEIEEEAKDPRYKSDEDENNF